eukprot:CAMPEP_0113539540 /NCGR_PEP_ID=MMETSP0015_2-20120614/7974_1 /TAXON_ID=2838 /ORGANISM="Odontella" /LENGTH=67 /DNA_ID=CAMNT_0000439229 /DNA_START=135 /DNA_END=338 /DNA_ORIENTATION=+ /assembly_acc=CAM_ASM_000160
MTIVSVAVVVVVVAVAVVMVVGEHIVVMVRAMTPTIGTTSVGIVVVVVGRSEEELLKDRERIGAELI